ncbi:MAG: DNA-directed RNA polymerase subunit omega [Desulfobacterales bacterium]|nr:DNA-directed RNA polymerase subunit omega [Desulfobacterales bacterium]
MARVTIEDCLKRIPNRFFLVHVTTKRVRQLNEGAPHLIENSGNEDVVTALREIAAGKVFIKEEEEPDSETEESAE